MLKELLSANIDLYIDQGDTYYKVFTIKDNTGTLVNLTGMTVSVNVRKYANTAKLYPLTATVTEPTLGKIILSMTPAESILYTGSRYVYDIRLSDGTDTVKIMTGQILVEAGAASLSNSLSLNGNVGSGNV